MLLVLTNAGCLGGMLAVGVPSEPAHAGSDLSGEMEAGYDPPAVEAAWYAWWEAQGYFKPALDADGKPRPEGTFTVPIPPPNVTGDLHLGHALTVAVQDCLVRWCVS